MVCIMRQPENVRENVETILSVNAPTEEMREAFIGVNDNLFDMPLPIFAWFTADSIIQFL